MKSKHAAFYKKYEALKCQEEKLEFRKQSALSLSPKEALDFLLGGIGDFGKFVLENKNKWTAEERAGIRQTLDGCAAMLEKMKSRRRLVEAA